MIVALLAASVAAAGPAIKPSREPLPAREVERSVVLPKGWTEVELGVSRKQAERVWTADGGTAPSADPFVAWTETLRVRHGFAPGHEVWLELPWHQVAVGDEGVGGAGDVAFGWRGRLLRHEPPARSLAAEVTWESASARDGVVPLGSGVAELRLGLAGRAELGTIAIAGRGAWARPFADQTAWAGDEVAPGARWIGEVEILLQAGPLVLGARPELTWRGVTSVGDRPVHGSDGLALDVHGRASLSLTRAVELALTHTSPVLGEDHRFLWVEELHPTRGASWGGELRVRF